MSGLNDWHQSETGRLHRIGFAVNPIGTGSGKEDRVICGIATFYPLLRMANVTAWIKSAATRRIGNPAPRMLKASNVRLSEFFEKPEKSVLFRHCVRHRLD